MLVPAVRQQHHRAYFGWATPELGQEFAFHANVFHPFVVSVAIGICDGSPIDLRFYISKFLSQWWNSVVKSYAYGAGGLGIQAQLPHFR